MRREAVITYTCLSYVDIILFNTILSSSEDVPGGIEENKTFLFVPLKYTYTLCMF